MLRAPFTLFILQWLELISCDYCRALYHPKCHPEITSSDVEGFRCHECEKVGKKRRVACGFCDGCKREDDCGTCVVCVVKQSGSKTKHKCIFKKCQSWGKDVMKEEEDNDGEGEGDDHHDSVCDKCKEGGGKLYSGRRKIRTTSAWYSCLQIFNIFATICLDLICCDNCPKVFHSNCHRPKIYNLPDGRWTCMYCTVKPTIIMLPKYSRPLIADTGNKEMTVTVKWPVVVCKVCSDTESKRIDWFITNHCIHAHSTHSKFSFSSPSHNTCFQPRLDDLPCMWWFVPPQMLWSNIGWKAKKCLEMSNMQRK